MNNSVKSNTHSTKATMYENTLIESWGLLGNYLEGEYAALVLIVSTKRLSEPARNALESSFAKLGYGRSACTFLCLDGFIEGSGSATLGGKGLFAAIEGLDPLFLVITDEGAGRLCAEAYKQPLVLDKRSRLFGRELRAFASFESMLQSPEGKQRAWSLLKSLPGSGKP